MREDECQVTDKGIEAVVARYEGTTGIRDLEQAAEHIAANALYRIEAEHAKNVIYDEHEVKKLLG